VPTELEVITMEAARPEVTGRATAGVASIDPDELIAARAAAKLLHVRPDTLTGWRHEGRGPRYVKVGRFVFYRRADISAWLATQLREPDQAYG
jgi:predicted DNA-binding transcriptional regulator AlpA